MAPGPVPRGRDACTWIGLGATRACTGRRTRRRPVHVPYCEVKRSCIDERPFVLPRAVRFAISHIGGTSVQSLLLPARDRPERERARRAVPRACEQRFHLQRRLGLLRVGDDEAERRRVEGDAEHGRGRHASLREGERLRAGQERRAARDRCSPCEGPAVRRRLGVAARDEVVEGRVAPRREDLTRRIAAARGRDRPCRRYGRDGEGRDDRQHDGDREEPRRLGRRAQLVTSCRR